MIAGLMRDEIIVQKPVESRGKAGSRSKTWQTVAKFKAQLVKEQGGEHIQNSEMFGERVLKFNVHKAAETMKITEDWRIVYNGQNYDVKFVERFDLRMMLQITCSRVQE